MNQRPECVLNYFPGCSTGWDGPWWGPTMGVFSSAHSVARQHSVALILISQYTDNDSMQTSADTSSATLGVGWTGPALAR